MFAFTSIFVVLGLVIAGGAIAVVKNFFALRAKLIPFHDRDKNSHPK